MIHDSDIDVGTAMILAQCWPFHAGAALCIKDYKLHTSTHTHTHTAPFHAGVTHKHARAHTHTHTPHIHKDKQAAKCLLVAPTDDE